MGTPSKVPTMAVEVIKGVCVSFLFAFRQKEQTADVNVTDKELET